MVIDRSDVDDVAAYRSSGAASSVVERVNLDRGPIGGLAVTADGRRLLATNYGDDTVSIIDAASCTVVGTVFGADEPYSIAAGVAGSGWAYVTAGSTALDAVLAIDIDTAHIAGCYPVAMDIGDLVADPTSSRVYITRTGSSGVDVVALDAAMSPTDSVGICQVAGATAAGLRISADGQRLYATVRQPAGDVITVLDRALNVLDTITVGATVVDIAVSSNGARLYVATCSSEGRATLHIVDGGSHALITARGVDAQLIQLIASRDGERVFLITAVGVLVMCARSHEIFGRLTTAKAPSCAVESPDGSRLYIADFDGAVTIASLAGLPTPSSALHDQLALDNAVSRLLLLEPAV